MALTIEDLKEKLTQVDEISLLEILEINAEMLVNRFEDLIEARADQFEKEFEDDAEE